MGISILLADEHRLVREGLLSLFEKQPGLDVVAEAGDGRTAVRLALKHEPDIVAMETSMPLLNGIEATGRITAHNPKIRVLGLSRCADRQTILKMLRSGASGYILKDSSFDELVSAVNAVYRGNTYLSSSLSYGLIKDYIQLSPEAGHALLTDREREVLQLLSEGRSTKQAASLLNLSVKTIETHRQQIMTKLEMHSIAELTKYAVREGLTTL